MKHEVHVDPAEKVSLWFRKNKTRMYHAEESADGVITLTPAVPVPARVAVAEPLSEPEMA